MAINRQDEFYLIAGCLPVRAGFQSTHSSTVETRYRARRRFAQGYMQMRIPESIRAIVETGPLGHLTTLNADGSPQVAVVWSFYCVCPKRTDESCERVAR